MHGWIVERHLRDDDVVLFNPPTFVTKMSIMGHRAKVLDWYLSVEFELYGAVQCRLLTETK
jgi:DNA-directed RNA polymerase beta' subunit